MKENYNKFNKRYSKEINAKELLSDFNSDPAILALPKDEREWLRNHCEFTMDTKDPKNAKRAVKLFNKKGYECVCLWNKDHIHPIEKHFGLHLISVYAPVEEAYKISKIASKGKMLIFSTYHYYHIHLHPLISGLYPIDVLDVYMPVYVSPDTLTGVKLIGIRLFDTASFLEKYSSMIINDINSNCWTVHLYESETDMLSGVDQLKLAGIDKFLACKNPEMEFGNIVGPLLIVDHSFDQIDKVAKLLEKPKVKRSFIGIPVEDGDIPPSVILKKYLAKVA